MSKWCTLVLTASSWYNRSNFSVQVVWEDPVEATLHRERFIEKTFVVCLFGVGHHYYCSYGLSVQHGNHLKSQIPCIQECSSLLFGKDTIQETQTLPHTRVVYHHESLEWLREAEVGIREYRSTRLIQSCSIQHRPQFSGETWQHWKDKHAQAVRFEPT